MKHQRIRVIPRLGGIAALGLLLVVSSAPARGFSQMGPEGALSAARALVGQHSDPARYMEDTPEETYSENRANPWQAWALAFFPAAIVKGVTISLGYAFAEKYSWAPYLPLIPAMGHSHFWETKVWWAGVIALGGDLIGSALLSIYFSEVYNSTPTTRPEKTMLWAGIGVMVAFFLYENISAPIVAAWHNKRLREHFKPASDDDARQAMGPQWRFSPWPDQGSAQIGPAVHVEAPLGAAYAFQF